MRTYPRASIPMNVEGSSKTGFVPVRQSFLELAGSSGLSNLLALRHGLKRRRKKQHSPLDPRHYKDLKLPKALQLFAFRYGKPDQNPTG